MRDNAALITRIRQGDEEAKNTMIEENMGLVHSIVKRFVGRGCEKEDLIQIGAIGLIKAINKFDEKFEVQFSTYAVPMIIGEIKRFMRDDGIIHISRYLKEAAIKGKHTQEILQKSLGRMPSIKEISNESGIEEDVLIEAFEASAPPNSIYESVYSQGDKEIHLMDTLSDKDQEENVINKVLVAEILRKLSARERSIIMMRYFEDKTQAEVAKQIGVSQVQISRIEKKIVDSLKKEYSNMVL